MNVITYPSNLNFTQTMEFKNDANVYWGTPDNQPPPSEPVCGYSGELCQVDNTGKSSDHTVRSR